MTVGIPGTGIGGLFYLALAIVMPILELFAVARGHSSLARWRFIGTQLLLIAAMLGLLAAQGVLLKYGASQFVAQFPNAQVSHDLQTVVAESSTLASTGAWISIGMLVTIVLLVQVAKYTVRATDHFSSRRLRVAARRVPLMSVAAGTVATGAVASGAV